MFSRHASYVVIIYFSKWRLVCLFRKSDIICICKYNCKFEIIGDRVNNSKVRWWMYRAVSITDMTVFVLFSSLLFLSFSVLETGSFQIE